MSYDLSWKRYGFACRGAQTREAQATSSLPFPWGEIQICLDKSWGGCWTKEQSMC